MKVPKALAAALGLSIAMASLVAVPASAAPAQPAASQTPVTVSVALRTVDTPAKSGQNAILRVKVGETKAIRVMVDTGITGLLLWGDTPRGAQILDTQFEARVGGKDIRGFVGRAPMTIGGVTTTRDVEFAKITTENAYIERWKDLGVSGIIGLSTSPGELTNPLMSMPGELSRGWSLHFERNRGFGELVLGATAPLDGLMHFTLPSAGVDANGSSVWDDHAADGCWAFADGDERCVPTWFDSGFTVMRVIGRTFADLPVTPGSRLRKGTSVQLAAGSSAFFGYSFVAGRKGSKNLVRVIPRGTAVINTGNAVYFDYTVTYRVDSGDIYLQKEGLA